MYALHYLGNSQVSPFQQMEKELVLGHMPSTTCSRIRRLSAFNYDRSYLVVVRWIYNARPSHSVRLPCCNSKKDIGVMQGLLPLQICVANSSTSLMPNTTRTKLYFCIYRVGLGELSSLRQTPIPCPRPGFPSHFSQLVVEICFLLLIPPNHKVNIGPILRFVANATYVWYLYRKSLYQIPHKLFTWSRMHYYWPTVGRDYSVFLEAQHPLFDVNETMFQCSKLLFENLAPTRAVAWFQPDAVIPVALLFSANH